jgi:hypothetical protein
MLFGPLKSRGIVNPLGCAKIPVGSILIRFPLKLNAASLTSEGLMVWIM